VFKFEEDEGVVVPPPPETTALTPEFRAVRKQ
jgi:hypothetical protein